VVANASGLTLAEIKNVAGQVGIDPVFVERAARLSDHQVVETPLQRLFGGPVRHSESARFPFKLDEQKAALLLSAVRISAGLAGKTNKGHSSPIGMTWHDGGDLEALNVTARPEKNGTNVSVVLDRRTTLGMVAMGSFVGILFGLLFSGSALYPESPTQGLVGAVVTVGGVLALARGYWASSTKRARERMNGVIEAIGQTLGDLENQQNEVKKIDRD
jgi:hypothetical protein